MPVICLSAADVRRLLPIGECVELMERTLLRLERGAATQTPRWAFQGIASTGRLGLMPAHFAGDDASYGLKAMCIFPDNPARGLEPYQGAAILFDGETGELRALASAAAVTSLRTAAVTALATRVLAREDARELTVVGAGTQVGPHLEALAHVRDFRRARIWSRTAARAREVADGLDVPFAVEPVAELEDAVRGADVVVTLTGAREPIVRREWLAPGAHVNAVGASTAAGCELDAATIVDGSLFVDGREAAAVAAGDYLAPLRAGLVGPEHVRAELGEVLAGTHAGRASAQELTVFKSVGLSVEDLAVVRELHARASADGTGTRCEL